jgi:hypothetical protein
MFVMIGHIDLVVLFLLTMFVAEIILRLVVE